MLFWLLGISYNIAVYHGIYINVMFIPLLCEIELLVMILSLPTIGNVIITHTPPIHDDDLL